MGRLKHLQQGLRSFGHLPNTKLQRANEAYGFGGAEFWWDAGYGLSNNVDEGAISFWDDKINNSRWVQGTAAQQPILLTQSTLNKKYPSVYFNGAKAMTPSVGEYVMLNKTILIVTRAITFGLTHIIGNTGTSVQSISLGASSGQFTGIGTYTSLTFSARTSIFDLESHIIVITPTGIIVDGVLQATGTIRLGNANTLANVFGGSINSSAVFELGEWIIYNRALSNQQGVELSDNVNLKWGIYGQA